jgi:hypothetical protein
MDLIVHSVSGLAPFLRTKYRFSFCLAFALLLPCFCLAFALLLLLLCFALHV